MNILSKALDDIKRTIPIEILNIAFRDTSSHYRRAPVSLDELIMSEVIRPRVLLDANLLGGQQVIINLEGLQPIYFDTYTIFYDIPSERLNNRTIISVLSVGYLPYSSNYNELGYGMGTINPTSMSNVLSAGQRVMDSASNIPPISNATVELVGHNAVLIRDTLRVTNSYQLRCMVSNDEQLNNISPRSFQAFSGMCILAVKSHIYNTMIIKLDQAYLSGGQELGAVKNIIEGYSDSEEMYQTYLKEKWQVVAYMNDTLTYNRHVRLLVNPAL